MPLHMASYTHHHHKPRTKTSRATRKRPPMSSVPTSISGLVVEHIVAIDVTRVRFPADAICPILHLCTRTFGKKTKPRSKNPQLQAITLRSTKTPPRPGIEPRSFCVTGGNTNHYTTTDLHDPICREDSKKTCFYPDQEAHKYSCVAATTHDQHTEQTQYVRFSKCNHATNGSNKKSPSINSHHPFHFCTAALRGGVETVSCSIGSTHIRNTATRKYLLIQTGLLRPKHQPCQGLSLGLIPT